MFRLGWLAWLGCLDLARGEPGDQAGQQLVQACRQRGPLTWFEYSGELCFPAQNPVDGAFDQLVASLRHRDQDRAAAAGGGGADRPRGDQRARRDLASGQPLS